MHTSSRDFPTLYVLVSYIEVVCCPILEIDSCAVETRITKFSHILCRVCGYSLNYVGYTGCTKYTLLIQYTYTYIPAVCLFLHVVSRSSGIVALDWWWFILVLRDLVVRPTYCFFFTLSTGDQVDELHEAGCLIEYFVL